MAENELEQQRQELSQQFTDRTRYAISAAKCSLFTTCHAQTHALAHSHREMPLCLSVFEIMVFFLFSSKVSVSHTCFAIDTRWLEAEYKVKADDAWAAAESSKAFTERLEHDRTLLQERVQVCILAWHESC